MRRLLALRREGKLTTGQVRSAADVLGVRERAVWRWLAAAERDEAAARAPGERAAYPGRFTVTDEVRALLGLWKGNVAAVHRELTARAARGEGRVSSVDQPIHRGLSNRSAGCVPRHPVWQRQQSRPAGSCVLATSPSICSETSMRCRWPRPALELRRTEGAVNRIKKIK